MKKNKESDKINLFRKTEAKPQFDLTNQFSIKPLKPEGRVQPSVSFNNEIIKIFNVKNIPNENNSFENKYKDKIESVPYFKYKRYRDNLNETVGKNGQDFVQKCEIQIYKTDKPFFLRPCMSFRIKNNSECEFPKVRIKRQRKKLAFESNVAKSIEYNNRKLITHFETSNKMFDEIKRSKKNPKLRNDQENQAPIFSDLFDNLKINKKTDVTRRWISKIPIRKGSSLERRVKLFEDMVEPKKKFKFDAKKYDAIFEKMKQNDRENRFYYLAYSLNKEKNNSKKVVV